MTAATRIAERIHIATIILVCALIAIVTLWQLSTHASVGRFLWAAVLTSPLSLPLRGLIHRNRRTHAAMTLCVIPYFVLGVTETVANPSARWWAGLCLSLALLLFVALIGYLRLTGDRVIK